jgi:hypothetical protein
VALLCFFLTQGCFVFAAQLSAFSVNTRANAYSKQGQRWLSMARREQFRLGIIMNRKLLETKYPQFL